MSARDCRRCGHARDGAAGHRPYIPGAATLGPCRECRCWQYLPERPLMPLLRRLLGWPRPRHAWSPPPSPPDIPQQRSEPCPLPGPEAYNGQTCLDLKPLRARPFVPGPREGD